MKTSVSNPDPLAHLRSFEGASASFQCDAEEWTLWLPEFSTEEHPLTPASQIFFRVILRRGGDTVSIRFVYECGSHRLRYYPSAIPEAVARRFEFENAISELFRHSLPIEPVQGRSLRRSATPLARPTAPEDKGTEGTAAAELDPKPDEGAVDSMKSEERRRRRAAAPPRGQEAPPARAPAPGREAVGPLARPAGDSPSGLAPVEPVTLRREVRPRLERTVRVEIGPGLRTVLLATLAGVLFLALSAMGVYAYLEATKDPGLEHHRLQLEAMKLQSGR